jgi:hypothetical protein
MKKLNFFKIALFLAISTTGAFAQSISNGTGGSILPNSLVTNLNVGIDTTTPTAKLEVTSIPSGVQTAIIGKGISTGVFGEATDMNGPLTDAGIAGYATIGYEAIGVHGKGTYLSTGGNGNIYGVVGTAGAINPLNNVGVFGEAHNANGYNSGVIGLSRSTTGIYNSGVHGRVELNTSAAWNKAIWGVAPVAPNHFAGYFDGKLAVVDGSQANNYVLTSDANGLATWTNPSLLGGSGWALNGNAASATDFLGTTNPQSLNIKTNNIDRAVITATGEIGIGTTTPIAQLEVSSTNVTNPAVIVNGKSVGVYAESTDQSSALIKRSNEYGDLDGIAVFGKAKYTTNTTNGSMYGVVGSATELNPLNNLGVMGEGKNATGYNTGVYGYVNSTTGYYNTGVAGEVKLNPTAIWNRAINGLAPVAPNHYAGYFDGNVDIKSGVVTIGNGTLCTPTGYKLFVEQGILTEKVKVAVNCSIAWADYVFADDYKLKPLSEVESFVKENKHLPNVPSAEELEKEGLDLGVMQSLQMAKIEELTLYIIEMKKEIDVLKTQISKK